MSIFDDMSRPYLPPPCGIRSEHFALLDELVEGTLWRAHYVQETGHVELQELSIEKRAPQGVHFRTVHRDDRTGELLFKGGEPRWMAAYSKNYCCTRREALERFLKKKKAHVKHAKRRLKAAEDALLSVELSLTDRRAREKGISDADLSEKGD